MYFFRLPRLLLSGCLALLVLAAGGAALAADWPHWRGPRRDGTWTERGLIQKFAGPAIARTWKAPVANGYNGPTVAAGRVYVMDRLVEPEEMERVLCFDEKSGEQLWVHRYPASYKGIGYPDGPRASVAVQDGRAYSLGTAGHLHCLDAATGKVLWKHDLNAEYRIRMPIWGISPSPLLYGDTVITHIGGSNGACLVAFDLKSGEERWRALDDMGSYSTPIVIKQAGKDVLICRTGDRVVGMDPSSGKLHWAHPFPPKKMVIAIGTPIVEKDRLFLTSFYDGSLMLRLKQDELGVEKLWEAVGPNEIQTAALQSIISTPIMIGDYVYGVDSYGQLRCLDARTGERVWESQDAVPKARWATIHFVKQGDRVWMFNERGDLIIAKLSPKGYEEISRTHLIDPTQGQLPQRGGVCWSHPAFANGHIFARSDTELVCADLRSRP